MAKQGYSASAGANEAKALGSSLPISTKQSIMICKAIRGKKVEKAKQILQEFIEMKKPVPFTRFRNGLGHKKGPLTTGRYPIKSLQKILHMLNSAEKNAEYKGLSTQDLVIKHINAHRGPGVMRYGRKSVDAKRTHIEIILQEVKKQ